jgi:hypothetical protein
MLKQPLSNSTAKISMAVPSQSTKPVPAKTVLQAVVAAADALMALAATSVAVAAVVVMTAVAVVVVAAVDAATSVVVNSSL